MPIFDSRSVSKEYLQLEQTKKKHYLNIKQQKPCFFLIAEKRKQKFTKKEHKKPNIERYNTCKVNYNG